MRRMGEFSRRHIRPRLAEPGEELVLTSFGSGNVRGFAATGDLAVAVGLPPGTEIRFTAPVATESAGGAADAVAGRQVARLRQVIVDNPSIHHDALEFGGAQLVLLTQLCEGQRVTVVRLPPSEEAATPFRRDSRRLPLEDIRLLAEPADEAGHPLFI
jgi:hypothetical protein